MIIATEEKDVRHPEGRILLKSGKTLECFPSPFSEIWSSFMRINRRYTEAKQTYQSYTLEETLSKLREA